MSDKWNKTRLRREIKRICQAGDPFKALAKQMFEAGVTEAELHRWLIDLPASCVPIEIGKMNQLSASIVVNKLVCFYRDVRTDAEFANQETHERRQPTRQVRRSRPRR